jgi:hypothetical protein
MKHNPYIISSLVAFIFVGMISCRKDKTTPISPLTCADGFDSIFHVHEMDATVSSVYLAAYPGSWWEYSNDVKLFCEPGQLKTTVFASTDSGQCQNHFEQYILNGPKIVNQLGGNPLRIVHGDYYVYQIDDNGIYTQSREVHSEFFDENMDSSWMAQLKHWKELNYPCSSTETKNLLSFHETYTLPNGAVFDNVAECRSVINVSNKVGGYTVEKYSFYAQGVGLIMVVDPDDMIEGPGSEYYLEDYFIAPH